jgi:methylamine dehydrogenase heavy chain
MMAGKALLTVAATVLWGSYALAETANYPTPLPEEPIPNVEKLPSTYPATWFYAHDLAFYSILDGKVVILDAAAETKEYKGQIGAGQMATFIASRTKPELYVAETFYSRRIDGERSDYLTVYDKSTLAKIAEVELPGGKRGQFVTQKNAMQLIDDEKKMLIFNFTPAASVTVVDLVDRKVLNEINVPGCSLVYPTGKSSFSTFCADGGMATFALDADGQVTSEHRTKPFQNIDDDPLFMKTVAVGKTNYFVSFKGRVQPIDFSGDKPKVGKAWSLVNKEDAAANWRPGGWQILTADAAGRLYVLMHEGGVDGSHKNGGSEVWVMDLKKQTRVARLPLKTWAISIEATQSDPGYLVAVNADMDLDIYQLPDGTHLRTLGDKVAGTPFVLHPVSAE